MAFGHISRLMLDRGFGFIVEDGQEEEVEFHWTALEIGDLTQLRGGERVEFERRPDHRSEGRFRAVKVHIIGRGF